MKNKFIHINEAIYRSVYFSLKHLDLRFMASHGMFHSRLAGDIEEGTMGSILVEFHQSCVLKVCSVLFFQKILISSPSSRICHTLDVLLPYLRA